MKTITLSVQQFNTFVKNIFDAEEFLIGVGIFGEVSNFKISSGNAYFELKDEGAVISCIKFGALQDNLNLENGQKITVYGKPNFYVKSGKLSFIVSRCQESGIGELYAKFIELKNKLENEGYFKEENKQPIYKFAKNIGIVTSETGAVIRDIINVTRAKNPIVNLVVYPSKVQGTGAEDEISNGIAYFNSRDDIDTIIIARGGGSPEDLAPFNTEKIVKAIYSSKIPVISAVGHETDFTLCDFASDLRVPTPSVAAEVAVYDYYEQLEKISNFCNKLNRAISKFETKKIEEIKNISFQSIDKFKYRLLDAHHKIGLIKNALENSMSIKLQMKKNKIDLILSEISKKNPIEIIRQGYVMVTKDGKKVKKAQHLNIDEKINLNMQDGVVSAIIKEIKLGENKWNLKKD